MTASNNRATVLPSQIVASAAHLVAALKGEGGLPAGVSIEVADSFAQLEAELRATGALDPYTSTDGTVSVWAP
jgi:hypothetical protein